MCEFVVDLGYLDDILDRSWDSGGLKTPRYWYSRLPDGLDDEDFIFHGFKNPRLFIPPSFRRFSKSELNKEDNSVVRKRRLKDAKPEGRIATGSNPWKQEAILWIRLEDGERQRVFNDER
jgi:hypothetical protein